jgi:hypothetical protein
VVQPSRKDEEFGPLRAAASFFAIPCLGSAWLGRDINRKDRI